MTEEGNQNKKKMEKNTYNSIDQQSKQLVFYKD